MKIAVMSDSHDNWNNLEKAVEISNQLDCKYLLFAGDLIGSSGIKLLEKFKGEVFFIVGNHEGELFGIADLINKSENLSLAGGVDNGRGVLYEGEIENRKIIMYHYPRLIKLAAQTQEFDICIFGHTHKLVQEKIGNTLLLNPGTLQSPNSLKQYPVTFCIVDLDDLSVDIQKI